MRLSIESLQAWHGHSQALFGVDLHVAEGETVALIGRNGAGKSTTLQCAIGMLAQRSGSIQVGGHNPEGTTHSGGQAGTPKGAPHRGGQAGKQARETIGLSPHRIARLGVALVPQGRRIFRELTVEENLRAGIRSTACAGIRSTERSTACHPQLGVPRGAGARHDPDEALWSMERLFEVFPLLAEVRSSKGGWLSGGEQQVLAIARALISNPRLLLLDEPTEGLAPRVVETLAEQLLQVKAAGLTILLAEQHLGLVRELAARAYVIDRGVVRAEGEPAQLLADERIRHAYLSL